MSTEATQEISNWLEKLSLGQYAQRFAENDIDFALLTKATDADLKELGVASLGHRKRLLEAIAERTAAMPSTTPAEPKARLRPLLPTAFAFAQFPWPYHPSALFSQWGKRRRQIKRRRQMCEIAVEGLWLAWVWLVSDLGEPIRSHGPRSCRPWPAPSGWARHPGSARYIPG